MSKFSVGDILADPKTVFGFVRVDKVNEDGTYDLVQLAGVRVDLDADEKYVGVHLADERNEPKP